MSKLRVNIRVLQVQHSNINSDREATRWLRERRDEWRAELSETEQENELAGARPSSCLRLF